MQIEFPRKHFNFDLPSKEEIIEKIAKEIDFYPPNQPFIINNHVLGTFDSLLIIIWYKTDYELHFTNQMLQKTVFGMFISKGVIL